jgi:hypothetical protein
VLIGSRIILRDISTKSIVTPPDGRSGPPVHIILDMGIIFRWMAMLGFPALLDASHSLQVG